MKNLMIINNQTLVNNVKIIRQATSKNIMCVLKSNAYNLGVKSILKQLLNVGVDFWVFNHYSEYLICQEMLKDQKVLILETIVSKYLEKIPENVRISVNALEQAKELLHLQQKVSIHIQVDTGMNRDGIKTINELSQIIQLLNKKDNINIEGIYTHFISDKNDFVNYNKQQERFLTFLSVYDFKIIHTAATSSLAKNIIGNYVRVGMGMYGFHSDLPVKPVVSVYAPVINIRESQKNESVGYSAQYISPEDELIGVLPVGYYEGFQGRYVSKGSKNYDVVGKICMNHTFIKVDKTIKKGTWLNIFPISDKINKREEINYYHILTAYQNFSRIYITEYFNDIRKIFKNPNQKGFKLRKRARSY